MTDAVDRTAETIRPMNRPRMNWMRVLSGTRRKRGLMNIGRDPQTGSSFGRVAIYQRETSSRVSIQAVNSEVAMPTVMVTAKPLHRPGTEHEQHHVRQKGGGIAVEDRAVGAREAVLQRGQRRPAQLLLLADALVDQDVGVHRHAQRQQDARHARQGQRRLQQRHDGQHQDQVDHQGEVREPAEQAVEKPHERDDEQEADDQRNGAGPDAVGAEFGADACAPRPPSAAPAARRRAAARRDRWRELAVNDPLIWPRPPVIASRITGAEITLSSSTIANR